MTRKHASTSANHEGEPSMNPRQTFRNLLAAPGIVVQPGIFDPYSARVAELTGFKAIGLGGFALGTQLRIAEPLLCLEDVAMATRYVTASSHLPLMVDAGAGWGEPLHVMHTVQVLERAGASSIHIEDQIYPKRAHYHRGVEHLIPAEDMVVKVRAALDARRDPDMVIVARTDAMRTDGYSEAIRRARLYHEAGADVIMIFPNNENETRQVPRDLPGVHLVYANSEGNRVGRGLFSASQLESWGWKVMAETDGLICVAGDAVEKFLVRLKQQGSTGLDQAPMIEIRERVERNVGLEEYYKIEEATVEKASQG
jgi:methylisocitrate lyase